MSDTESAIRALEKRWLLALPESFRRLYQAFEHPFISPCEFLSLDLLIEDGERWSGMLPQFLPFGHDGAEDFYGFYVPPITDRQDYPVLFWNHEYDHYYPISSGFGAFLRWCVIYGRYLAQDTFDEHGPGAGDEEEQRLEFARIVGLPRSLLTDALPRNDRELYERLMASDPQGAHAAAQLGSVHMGRGDIERARDFFCRASEATPWFADPYYLIAETYMQKGDMEAAITRWEKVINCPIALSTRTANYDLGQDHPEAEIYEATAAYLVENADRIPQQNRSPIIQWVLDESDIFEAGARLELADSLRAHGDAAGEERELLNALTLATEPADTTETYDRLIRYYEGARRHRDAALCRSDSRRC